MGIWALSHRRPKWYPCVWRYLEQEVSEHHQAGNARRTIMFGFDTLQ